MSRLGTRRRLGCSPMVGRAPTACRQPEAAHASTNSRPTPAIRSMHAYRQQHKPKKIDQHKMGPKPEQPSPEVPRSAFRARRRCGDARDAWARPPRTQPPHDCSAVAQTRRRARPARVRGLPDADHAHLHATDHTRHAQHPVNSALLANSEFSARLQCPRTRRDGRDCVEPLDPSPDR